MEIDEVSNEVIAITDPQSPEINGSQHENRMEMALTPPMPNIVLASDSGSSTLSTTAEAVTTQTTDQSPDKEKECKDQPSSSKMRPYEECNIKYDDDGKFCPICHDWWNNLGEHRICALECGHVFGARCIIRLLSLQKEKSCPICKREASESGMRYIVAQKVVPPDVTELEQMRAQLDNAIQRRNRIKAELAEALERLRVQRLEDLEREIERCGKRGFG